MRTTRSSTNNGRAAQEAMRPKRHRRRRRRGRGSRSSSSGGSSSSGWSRHGTALPSWADLERPQNRRRDEPDTSFLQGVSTVRFALLVLLVAGAFTLYVGHVHATKDLLTELQEARTENQQLHLKHNRLKGEFDRKTGPSVIYDRAREMGLQESMSYGPSISIDD